MPDKRALSPSVRNPVVPFLRMLAAAGGLVAAVAVWSAPGCTDNSGNGNFMQKQPDGGAGAGGAGGAGGDSSGGGAGGDTGGTSAGGGGAAGTGGNGNAGASGTGTGGGGGGGNDDGSVD